MIDFIITILLILVNVSAVLNILLILKVFFGANLRLNRRILFVVAGTYFVLNFVFDLIPGMVNYTAVMLLVFMAAVICILSQSKRFKNIILVIPSALMYVQWGSMFDVLERLLGLDRFVYHYETMDVTMSEFVADIVLLIILFAILKKVNEEVLLVQFTKLEGVLVTIACIFYPVLVAFFTFLEARITHPMYRPFWLISMILVNVAVIYAIAHRKKAVYYKLKANQYKEQFQTEYDYFKDYKKNNDKTIKFRHDWNNHMLVMKEMFAKGEYERAKEYFAKLSSEFEVSSGTYVTGNEILDMILKSKHSIIEEHNIEFKLEGNLVPLDFMEDVDICILFSNLIDNALEANMVENDDRYINLTAKKANNLFYVELSNPFFDDDNQNVKDKSKEDIHGTGLENVRDIIEKYNGEQLVEIEAEIYTIRMCFTID